MAVMPLASSTGAAACSVSTQFVIMTLARHARQHISGKDFQPVASDLLGGLNTQPEFLEETPRDPRDPTRLHPSAFTSGFLFTTRTPAPKSNSFSSAWYSCEQRGIAPIEVIAGIETDFCDCLETLANRHVPKIARGNGETQPMYRIAAACRIASIP